MQKPQVSVVAVDLLWSLASSGNVSHVQTMLQDACSRGFTFLRFGGSLYWPLQMNQSYLQNETGYWAMYDTIVDLAAANGCLLMPTVAWNTFMFSDLVNESLGALASPATSAAFAAMSAYATKLVTRYATNPTIAAWELFNEFNLLADLNMTGSTDSCAPPLGTPAVRTAADNISTDGMIAVMSALAGVIRANDPLKRPVTTGHALPRPAAAHLRASYLQPQRDWTPDSVDEFNGIIHDVNSMADWITVHMYAGPDNARWNDTNPNSAALLYYVADAAALAGKPLYVGEFGDPLPGNRSYTNAMLAAMADLRNPLATVWVWEFYQDGTNNPAAEYSLLPGRDDAIISNMQAWNAQQAT